MTAVRHGESAEEAKAIRRLLAEGDLSLRAIGRATGTSHEQVRRVRAELSSPRPLR